MPIQTFPHMRAALAAMASDRPIRHWSFGMAHPDGVGARNHAVFAREVVPALARDHGVRDCICEGFPNDLPAPFLEWVGRCKRPLTALRAFQETGRRDVRFYTEGLVQHGREPTLATLPAHVCFGLCSFMGDECFALLQCVQRMQTEGIPLHVHGDYRSWIKYARAAIIRDALGFDLAAQNPYGPARVTEALRQQSCALLADGHVVALLCGAHHNCDPTRLDAESRSSAEPDTILPAVRTLVGDDALVRIYLLIPAVEQALVDADPTVTTLAHVQRAQHLAGLSRTGRIVLAHEPQDAWHYLICPPEW